MNAAFIRANVDTLKAVICDAVFGTEVGQDGNGQKGLVGKFIGEASLFEGLGFPRKIMYIGIYGNYGSSSIFPWKVGEVDR